MVKICKNGRIWGSNNSYSKMEYKKKLSEQKKGEKNPFYKGIPKQNYKYVVINGKTFLQHRIIMENHLGRKLQTNEYIHHINGNKLDNRIENLAIIPNGTKNHAKLHSDNRRLGIIAK